MRFLFGRGWLMRDDSSATLGPGAKSLLQGSKLSPSCKDSASDLFSLHLGSQLRPQEEVPGAAPSLQRGAMPGGDLPRQRQGRLATRMGRWGVLCLAILVASGLRFWPDFTAQAAGPQVVTTATNTPPEGKPTLSAASTLPGDAACARCHQAIYASYERTSMAQDSGPLTSATDSITDATSDLSATRSSGSPVLIPGTFDHAPSGIRYQVSIHDGQAWFSFARETRAAPLRMEDLEAPHALGGSATPYAEASSTAALYGDRRLEYFIGSGKHGRTYLYQVNGSWLELPINYYTRRRAWAMAPAFDQVTSMPADLPADPGCLHCHATQIATPQAGSRSHYLGQPFAQGGIGCSACHGDPSAHLASGGRASILNPSRLDPARRDSVCLSCHLEGDQVSFRAGKSLAAFKPGEDLAETAVYFVRANRTEGGGRAASQYEALLRSACKRAAGDRLTCTTCHDPHASPAPAERVTYYRAKCLACHTGVAMATLHHPEEQDCARCHMPSRATTDISHEQTVDHDIEARPSRAAANEPRSGETLLPVGGWRTSDRELGMAYAQLAEHGDREAGERALMLLVRAEASGASDAAMHSRLGLLRQLGGDRQQARAEYLAALQQDPHEPAALANLAVLDASTRKAGEALPLLERLLAADPTQTAAGLNLAFLECALGQPAKARSTLATLALYNPDDPLLHKLEDTGSYGGAHCQLRTSSETQQGSVR